MDFGYGTSLDIDRSNMSAPAKSRARLAWERVTGGGRIERATKHAIGAGHVLRQGMESAATGAALGIYEAKYGSLDKGKLPVDGLTAGAGMVLSVLAAEHEVSTDLRNVGGAGLAIFTQRKTKEFWKSRAANAGPMPPTGGAPHGDFGEDPVIAAARAMGG